MGQGASILLCPKGHTSSEADYCSECGARIQGSGPAAMAAQSSGAAPVMGDLCPDCGTVREQGGIVFCEVCGYNFTTGAHGEVPLPAPAETPSPTVAQPESAPTVTVQQWTVTVAVDPGLRSPESPEAPADVAPLSVTLTQPVSLIGRRNETRAIFPEIALDHDEAVSRRHALLQLDPEKGLLLRDIGAANGTRLNGKELQPMTDYPLNDGDEITLGHWSRISVKAS